MPAEPFKRERAAQIIAESVIGGIDATCKKYGISVRTLHRWKRQTESDTALAESVTVKMAAAEKDWAEELPEAIRAAIGFLKRAAESADVKDPDSIHSVAGGLKILTDVTMSRRILDTRLAKAAALNAGDSRTVGSAGEAPGQGDTGRSADQLGLQ